MKGKSRTLISCLAALLVAGAAAAQEVKRGNRAIFDVVPQLRNGEYVWAPELSPNGPALLVVNIKTQRAVLFRNGVPIAASTVSTGAPGHETPTGVFTILQKNKEHYSSTYNNAPMPNMQRLTWKGIALHAGKLPGYPASHGCIRLPTKFSSLLFGATKLGMTVIITDMPAVPQNSATPDLATNIPVGQQTLATAPYEWNPARSPYGFVSVVVSVADQRAIVIRNGVQIGSAPVRVGGPVNGAMAYALRAWDKDGQHWLKVQFSGAGGSTEVSQDEGRRFDTPVKFRQALATVMRPGSVLIVTPESLGAGSPGSGVTVIEEDVG